MLLPSNKLVFHHTKITEHFTWGEATKNCTRIPESLTIENNIINSAINLEKVRKMLGDRPLFINSWYRPKSVNDRIVGAAKNSSHIRGYAIDFKCDHLSPKEIYDILTSQHLGGLGSYGGFCHIDWRNWEGKIKARWGK